MLQVNNLLEVVVGFRTLGFTQYIGPLDGTHIRITFLPHGGRFYYSWLSIMLQAVVNHCSAFNNMSTIWEDSAHNAHLHLEGLCGISSLYRKEDKKENEDSWWARTGVKGLVRDSKLGGASLGGNC
ncbi:hypothetical protein Y1Q_0009883 [Alligator mississippiensis]|uniref:DDE Tnp4 domain-containing protein n=1 Tax=Alligator mississippiensis TaxID=8496 RepID=A0A151MX53_ALLMI|nr:hypothetical protein Y1Q_0009883 [Alligator mississippiensis]